MTIFFAVEDQVSGVVTERLIRDCAEPGVILHQLGKAYGGNGHIRSNMRKYIDLSTREKVVIMTDLDHSQCAPSLRSAWLSSNRLADPLPDGFVFCIAVREVEAWLLSDRDCFAEFIGISPDRIERDVESTIADPKEYLLQLARGAHKRDVRSDLLPAPRSGAKVGLSYNNRLSEFARDLWNPAVAAAANRSLQRAIHRIRDLV